MKETLDEQSRLALIQYRIERAEETIEEASLLSKESHFNAAINRLYYACFYAASALMVAYGLTASSHAGVKTMIGMHFVSKGLLSTKGLLSKEQGKAFSRLFEIRHSGDYDDFVMTRTKSLSSADCFITRFQFFQFLLLDISPGT